MTQARSVDNAGRGLVSPYSQRTILLVGVGGSGIKTIQAFRAVLQHATQVATGGAAGLGARYLFLAIDTDGGELATSGLDVDEYFTLDIDKAKRWYDTTLNHSESAAYRLLREWLPLRTEVKDGRLVTGRPVALRQTEGAGQRRLVSRMVAYHALESQRMRDRLETFLKKRADVSDSDPQRDFEVHVLFGLAGGTGSGATLQIAAELRTLIGGDSACKDFVGHAFLDTALTAAQYGVNATRVEANGCAALMEIEHFQKLGREEETRRYLTALAKKGVVDGEAGDVLPIHASSTVRHATRAPFNYLYLYEQTGRQSGVQAYQSAAEALFAATYHGVSQPSTSDYSNYQLQMSRIYGTATGLPGVTASYAAHGSCIVHLPRTELATYLSRLVVGDVLERTSPLQTDFVRLAADEQGKAELSRLNEEKRGLAALQKRASAATIRQKLGRIFLSSVVEVARSEARLLRQAGASSGDLTVWCTVARSLTICPEVPTLLGQLVARMQDVVSRAVGVLDVHLAPGLYAQKATYTSIVNARRTQLASSLTAANQLATQFKRDLASADFWAQLVGAETGLAANSADAGTDLPTVAELCLLYAIVAADLDLSAHLAATPEGWFNQLPRWDGTSGQDLEQQLLELLPDRYPGLFGARATALLAESATAADDALKSVFAHCESLNTQAGKRIHELEQPKAGLEKWLTKLTSDSTEIDVQGVVSKLVSEVDRATATAMRNVVGWTVLRQLAAAVRQAAIRRVEGFEHYSSAARERAQELRGDAHKLLTPASRGFLHDHEVLTDYAGAQRLWHWYYLDQVADVSAKRDLLDRQGAAQPHGGATLAALSSLTTEFMAGVRSQVAGLVRRDLAAGVVRQSAKRLADVVKDSVLAFLRERLTLERAFTLQSDYGQLEALRREALLDQSAPETVLAAYYDLVRRGKLKRATLDNGGVEDLVGKALRRCHDLLASPLARISAVDNAPDRPSSGNFAAIAIGATPVANLSDEERQRIADDRQQFIGLLKQKGDGMLSVIREQIPLLSPDLLIYYRRNLALIPEWFDEIASDADVLMNELQYGDAGPDLFTARQFTHVSVASDGKSIRRQPNLPFLSLAEQNAARHEGRDVEAAETRAALLTFLLLSRAVVIPDRTSSQSGKLGLRYLPQSTEIARWVLDVEWSADDREILQREEERLAATATDLLAIVRQVRRSTVLLLDDPRFGLSDEARTGLTQFIGAINALDDAMLSLMPEAAGGDTLLKGNSDAGARAALRKLVLDEIDARRSTMHDPVPGALNLRFPGHYGADIDRYAQLLVPLLSSQ